MKPAPKHHTVVGPSLYRVTPNVRAKYNSFQLNLYCQENEVFFCGNSRTTVLQFHQEAEIVQMLQTTIIFQKLIIAKSAQGTDFLAEKVIPFAKILILTDME